MAVKRTNMLDTLSDAQVFMSRSTGLPAHLGKATASVKAALPECVKEDFERKVRIEGFESSADVVRELIMVFTYGLEGVRRMHEDRLRKVAGIGPVSEQKADSMQALPTIDKAAS